MSIFASLVVAGALAFCETTPSSDLCAARAPTIAEVSEADIRRLERLATSAYIRARTPRRIIRAHDGSGRADDAWRIGAPQSRSDDCEDRVLWLADALRRDAPSLYAGFRPVLIVERRRDGVVSSHLVAAIETTAGTFVIDPRRLDLQRWRLDNEETYTPAEGIGGAWMRYSHTVIE